MTQADVGKPICLSADDYKTLFPLGINSNMDDLVVGMGHCGLLVREPVFQLHQLLAGLPAGKSARAVLHGYDGRGVSCSLAYLSYAFHKLGWAVVHVSSARRATIDCKLIAPSPSQPGIIDTPFESFDLLKMLASANKSLLQKHRLESPLPLVRDMDKQSLEAGMPLSQVAEFGAKNVKQSSEVTNLLLEKLVTGKLYVRRLEYLMRWSHVDSVHSGRVLFLVDHAEALLSGKTREDFHNKPIPVESLGLARYLHRTVCTLAGLVRGWER
jgi:hypothetical protein